MSSNDSNDSSKPQASAVNFLELQYRMQQMLAAVRYTIAVQCYPVVQVPVALSTRYTSFKLSALKFNADGIAMQPQVHDSSGDYRIVAITDEQYELLREHASKMDGY